MNRHIVSHVAIYLLSIVMLVFGYLHFKHPENFMLYVPPYLPGGRDIWVKVVGSAFILAAIAFIINKQVKLAAYLLAALLLIFVIAIHLPTSINAGDFENRQLALTNLLKDTALAAFALHIAGSADSHGMKF